MTKQTFTGYADKDAFLHWTTLKVLNTKNAILYIPMLFRRDSKNNQEVKVRVTFEVLKDGRKGEVK